MSKRVLIITREMLPYASSFGGCQRMYFLANQLSDNGCHVTVMAEKTGKKNRTLCGKDVKFETVWLDFVEPVRPVLISKQLLDEISDFLFNEISEKEVFSGYLWVIKQQRFVNKYIRKNRVDTVIISAPSFFVFSFVKFIRRHNRNVKIILDYRDPWNLWDGNRGFASVLEKRNILLCDRVVCFSDHYARAMQKRFPQGRDKYEVVYNGYNKRAWENIPMPATGQKTRMVIEYIGNISFDDKETNYRNPNKLVDAFIKFSKGRNIELRFVGIDHETTYMRNLKSRSEGKIRFVKTVSSEQSLEKMLEADVLLSIHTANNLSGQFILSGKLFDYLRSGKVVWNIGTKFSAMSRFVAEHKLGVSCENEKDQLEYCLNRLYDTWKKTGYISRRDYDVQGESFFSREVQNDKFLKILEGL